MEKVEIKESVGMLPSIKKKGNVLMRTLGQKVITPILTSLLIQSACELNSSHLLRKKKGKGGL